MDEPGDQVNLALLQVEPVGFSNISSDFLKVHCSAFFSPISLHGLFDFTVRTCVGLSEWISGQS